MLSFGYLSDPYFIRPFHIIPAYFISYVQSDLNIYTYLLSLLVREDASEAHDLERWLPTILHDLFLTTTPTLRSMGTDQS